MSTPVEKETIIEGRVYVTRMLPAMEGLKLTRDVVAIFGATLFSLKGIMGKDVVSPEFGAEIQALMNRLGDPVLDRLMPKIMGTAVLKDGDRAIELGPVFNLEFRGRLGELAQVVLFIVRAQCESFWSAFAGFMAPGAGATTTTR